METRAFVELTQNELNTLITVCNVRLSEIRDLYDRTKAPGQNTLYVANEYLRLKKALIMLEQPEWKTV